ncbi:MULTISPECIES: hypothetical protein [unclassified Leptolyngbya]|uniref:hypothetical protein n=1 Tax=unclassified Leptolyngbya TaxID=2650499 RepID=UPI00168A1565|nr:MULTISPECIES: hypothetical protein [unclassified Leptolyngbya]MBD1910629.1 hypothetical protein [Leptolyngbya sp. FACHB-8]MBD2154569.1 hypothetical protein [Leptolyngbya sp. FACHB-16]
MKCLRLSDIRFDSLGAIALGALAACISWNIATPTAQAQAAYGSYIGIGGSIGLTGGNENEDSSSGGVVAVRYRFLEVPISVRGQLLISDGTTFVPTVSYDIPITWDIDGYLGAGVALPFSGDDDYSPVGNQTAFVLQPGVDWTLPDSDLVVFGNAIIAFDAYEESGDTAASVQAGVGLQF